MRQENENNWVVLDGRRTDDGALCTLIVIHEFGGPWAFIPHGPNQLGVRLGKNNAVKVAREILAGPEPVGGCGSA
ncbi:MAG: hypothetical protein ACRDTG_10135 [Pseudonocardiaceae bacterium]